MSEYKSQNQLRWERENPIKVWEVEVENWCDEMDDWTDSYQCKTRIESGELILIFENEEDLVAFKLRFL